MWRAKPRCIALSSPAQTEKGVEWNSFVKPFMPYWKTYIGPWLCHINEVYASTITTAATTLLRSTVSPQAHLLVARHEHRYCGHVVLLQESLRNCSRLLFRWPRSGGRTPESRVWRRWRCTRPPVSSSPKAHHAASRSASAIAFSY